MAAVAEIYQRVIYQQQAVTPRPDNEGEFKLRTLSGIAVADQSNQQLLAQIGVDAPELFHAVAGLTDIGRKNLLRFLSSAYGSSERYAAVEANLAAQEGEAQWWRDACIAYFQSISKRPLPPGVAAPKQPLSYYQALRFNNVPGTPK